MSLRLTLLISLFSGGVFSAHAQTIFGTRLGVNVSTLTGDFASEVDSETRSGFVGGLYWTIPLRYGLAVQPEILYTQKGFKPGGLSLAESEDPNQQLEDLDAVLELTYVEIPVLIKVPLETSGVRLAPYAGPFFGHELAERLRIEEGGIATSDTNDDISSPNVGFAVGLDIAFPLNSFDLIVGGRFSRGLVNVLEDRVVSLQNSSSAHTRTVSFFVGVNL